MTNHGWRVFGIIGGGLGLASLLFPVVRVTGTVAGFSISQREYTALELLSELPENGDLELIHGVVFMIVGGAVLAVLGSLIARSVIALGGLMQGIGAGATAYAILTEEIVFAAGFGTAQLEPLVGLYLIGVAALVSVLSVAA